MRACLRLALAREDAFLVAVHAEDTGRGSEVGKVPDLLADDRIDPVEDAMAHVQDFDLVLFGPSHPLDAVETGHRISAIFGHDDRLVVRLRPIAEVRFQRPLSTGEVSREAVPAVVPVE